MTEKPSQPARKAKDTITVRTSHRPDQDIEVSTAEHLDLEAQGLLVKSELKGARLRQDTKEN